MTDKEKQFNQWFDEYADGVKVFEEADMKQAYLQGRAELENENKVLAQNLEDTEIINKALEKENAELKAKIYGGGYEAVITKKDADIILLEHLLKEQKELHKSVCDQLTHTHRNLGNQLTNAKELLKKWIELYKPKLEGYPITPIQEQTEQFLNSEVEK